MKIFKNAMPGKTELLALTGIMAMICLTLTQCVYMKMLPPPDADKAVLANNNSCWLATASNMLAGAGYGNGATVQDRAADIYADMIAHYGTANGGWTDVALSWWLSSANNTWGANPYTSVTVYGHKTRTPYARNDLPQFMGNELRRCQMLGVSISWPPASGGHAITCWGDNFSSSESIASNPTQVRMTDSDTDGGGDVQAYTYDDFTNPNPGGANDGNGWYFDYNATHPYIKHIVTLCPVDLPGGGAGTVKVLGSYSITNTSDRPATDLHYVISTDVDILSYRTTNNWSIASAPDITEANPRRSIEVTWNFTEKPVPPGTTVTISTEFVLASWNAMRYSDVYFTYPDEGKLFPEIYWKVVTPVLEGAEKISNVTGGYLLAKFEIVREDSVNVSKPIGEYRFYHEYRFNEDPEVHQVLFNGPKGYAIRRVSFGHSYTFLPVEELWQQRKWMTEMEEVFRFTGEPIEVKVNWEGKLPYPPADGPYKIDKPKYKSQ
jgi:hypothetical protein